MHFGFGVLCILGFGFRVLGFVHFGFWVSGFGLRALGFVQRNSACPISRGRKWSGRADAVEDCLVFRIQAARRTLLNFGSFLN